PELGLERGLGDSVGRARRDAGDAVAGVRAVVHRARGRSGSHPVRMGAADVRRGDQEAVAVVRVEREMIVMKRGRQHSIVAEIVVAMVAVATVAAAARSNSREDKIKDAAEQPAKAAKAFDAVMEIPDKAIPRDLLSRAKAVAVFPRVIKVAVTVGGE